METINANYNGSGIGILELQSNKILCNVTNNYARCGWSMPINHQRTDPRMTSKIFFVLLNMVNSIHNVYKFYEISERDNESDITIPIYCVNNKIRESWDWSIY